MEVKVEGRKGARKIQDIPQEVLNLLNTGAIETVNLTEWLAIDHVKLVRTNFQSIGISAENIELIVERIEAQKKLTAMATTKLVGATIYELYAQDESFKAIFEKLSTHLSDAIRCYATYLKALDEDLSINEKLSQSRMFVADHHFGVREVIWMALRPEITKDLKRAIAILAEWTQDKDENIRRFTTEATRPRGVWCKHIEELKENPETALPILERLKSDASKYVQDSVGNWLNDASKTQPDFVVELCQKWQQESPTKATSKIIKRAKRTINKGN